MTKSLLTVLVGIVLILATTIKVEAKGIPVRIGDVEKIIKVYELPDSAQYQIAGGKNFDLGYKYTVYEIMWLPAWTSDQGKLVGYIDGSNFVDLTADDVKFIADANGIENPESLIQMPFWDKIGGKLVLGLLAFLIILGIVGEIRKKTA